MIHYQKEIHDNTINDNVTVTSSNFCQNGGIMRVLAHFMAKNHSRLGITDKNLIR